MTTQTLVLEPLEEATTFDGVVRSLDAIIDWSIEAESTIGYFAVLYKRGTIAIKRAVEDGKFRDPQWIEQLDCVFAKRYFDALNAFFHPDRYERQALTLPWEVAFINHHNTRASMLQHMVASLNAHICYDLGIAVVELSADRLREIKPDFDRVNGLVALQTPDMLDIVQRRSPRLRLLRLAIPKEDVFIKTTLTQFREGAWNFAIGLALAQDATHEKRVHQIAWAAGLGAWYLEPPKKWPPIALLLRGITSNESRDVAGNLRALAGIADHPKESARSFL
ncbi:DUF5995 family protein [Mycolicibacterium setense]|uniref:DUF5995 family protein n=1 Tax=Mycolicibacterium setense TaxID=431269 RepID=UPI00068E5F8E|nr:DUF5995 family protein [Mycolicibacterium setense]MCV7111797.1 hypothetical protein [Mycolicibacterium setense]